MRDLEFLPLSDGGRYYIAMTAAHYKNLAYNWNAMVVSVEERTAVARYYKDCIDRHNIEVETDD